MNPKKFINDFSNYISEGLQEGSNRKLVECLAMASFTVGLMFFMLLDMIFIKRDFSQIVRILGCITMSYFLIRLMFGKNMIIDVICERMEEKDKEVKE